MKGGGVSLKQENSKKEESMETIPIDLLSWLTKRSNKLDHITLIGVLTVLVFYNTTLYMLVQKILSEVYSSVKLCSLNFYTFHFIIVLFSLISGILALAQIKKLKKNSYKELCNYLNESTLEKDLFTTNWVPRKKRKFTFYFVLSIILLLIPLIFYDWYKFLDQCNLKKALPLDLLGIVFYSALCIRLPIYLIAILNFKFGD